MKAAPQVTIPVRRPMSDIVEARRVTGREPKYPIGVVMARNAYAELRAYGARFPCPVAIDPTAPRDTVTWYYLQENFDRFANLILS